MGFVRAIDISRYQPNVYQAWFDELARDGVKLAIIAGYGGGPGGIQISTVAKFQRALAEKAGMVVWGYSLPPSAVKSAMIAIDAGSVDGDIAGFALDVESNSAGVGAAVHRADVDAIESTGRAALVYTNRNYWFPIQGSDNDYHDVALWEATYPREFYNVPYEASMWARAENGYGFEWGFAPYCGWTRRAAWQFGGNNSLHGVGLDLNLVDEDFFNAVQEASDVTTAEEKEQLAWLRSYREAIPEQDAEVRARTAVYLSDAEKDAVYQEIASPDEDDTGPPPASMAAALARMAKRLGKHGARLADHGKRLTKLEAKRP